MKKTNLATRTRLWLLVTTLITPVMGMAESPRITIDPVVHAGQFVIFVLKNYEDRGFVCTFIRARATVRNHQGNGHVITRRSIVVQDVVLPAGSREKRVEVGKEIIKELENDFNQPRIVDVTVPTYSCKPKTVYVTADKKIFRDVLKDGSLGPEMVRIPAGSFRMGDIQGDGGSDEKPVHTVSVKRFAMGKYEVTFAEYDKFAQATGRTKPGDRGWGRGNRPVINVSWYDAVAYTQWLSQQTGQKYRLPTEAEWEYAARAGTKTKYWWGNDIGSNKANCFNKHCGDRFKYTAPVGSFASNSFGLYDTVGNVWEWTCSAYEGLYQGSEQRCASNESRLALRGGSWNFGARGARSSDRFRFGPMFRFGVVGFRLAR